MSFNRLMEHVDSLVKGEAEVEDKIPCKSDILSLRECGKGGDPKVSDY
jgi:hypothetical protein